MLIQNIFIHICLAHNTKSNLFLEDGENMLISIFLLIMIEWLIELEEGWNDSLFGLISTQYSTLVKKKIPYEEVGTLWFASRWEALIKMYEWRRQSESPSLPFLLDLNLLGLSICPCDVHIKGKSWGRRTFPHQKSQDSSYGAAQTVSWGFALLALWAF